jgi:bacteriocin biosynthesis cyclodehydratase domain-containing protein
MSLFVMLVEGEFGIAVGTALAARVPEVITSPFLGGLPRIDEVVRRASFVGVATWRRYTEAMDELDAACTRHRVPWSSAWLDGTLLGNGPLVRADAGGPCFRCFRRRWRAHAALPEREEALEQLYRADPAAGVPGFLPSAVAAAASGLLLDARAPAESRGRIRIADLVSQDFEETKVVRVHGCPRCGATDGGRDRYVRALVPALREIS